MKIGKNMLVYNDSSSPLSLHDQKYCNFTLISTSMMQAWDFLL